MKGERLGEFELLVLLAALRLGETRAYAVSIADEIREQTGRPAQRAAVYVALQRLEKKSHVRTTLGEALAQRGGRPRRLVRVTAGGRAAAHALLSEFRQLADGLDLEPAEARSL